MQLRKTKYKGGFIAMTAYGTPEILKKIKTLGGLDIILKPFNLEWFSGKVLDYFSEEEGVSGTINSIDITSLLQMINLEKKDVTVKIDLKDKAGYLYFSKGEIIHAEFEDLKGEDAAKSLLNLNRGKFSLLQPKKKLKKTIETPFMALMMNIMKSHYEDVNLLALDDAFAEEESADVKADPDKQDDEGKTENKKNQGQVNKEGIMNVKKLNEAVEGLKQDLGDALLATDIFGTDDGQSVAAWNGNDAACALFNQITNYMGDALTGSGFPALGRYYILDLVDDKMVIVITMGDFQWGLFLDTAKVKLGLLLNVVIPKIVDSFEQAIAD